MHIVNELSHNKVLYLHCVSYNDNLGHHNLKYKAEFKFSFMENFLGATIFKCYMSRDRKIDATFTVFWPGFLRRENQDIDLEKDTVGSNVIWVARDDGIYLKRREACFFSCIFSKPPVKVFLYKKWDKK